MAVAPSGAYLKKEEEEMTPTEEKGVYVGPEKKWKGKTALLLLADDAEGWLAQFDEFEHPESHGWHFHSFLDFSVQLRVKEKKID